jgi:hypothetical protein
MISRVYHDLQSCKANACHCFWEIIIEPMKPPMRNPDERDMMTLVLSSVIGTDSSSIFFEMNYTVELR